MENNQELIAAIKELTASIIELKDHTSSLYDIQEALIDRLTMNTENFEAMKDVARHLEKRDGARG